MRVRIDRGLILDVDNERIFLLELLYKAPELLRSVNNFNTILIPGTQKGDIYSFAIILYEIHTR